jgi:hypothetical protein
MFNLQYEITKEDYLDADMVWYSRPWFKWIIIRGLPAFLIVSCIVSTLFFDNIFGDESEFDKLFFRFLLGADFLMGITFYAVMRPNILTRSIKKKINKSIDQDQICIGRRQTLVDEQGILITRENQPSKIYVLWKNIYGVQETSNLFIFCFFDCDKKKQRTFIPKRAFKSNNQFADFRNALALFNCSPSMVLFSFPHHLRSFGS